ncbi:MAG: hypothetical protein CM15mP117_14820 [Alphaproteobacteria bacterium]|nr:MAG: hypothetical protein CM15mP117_14820 [Alphaproteobacteria bacterium]
MSKIESVPDIGLPYGGKLFVKDGDMVNLGDVLIEWDPYTIPIITEVSGRANYVDLSEGITMREAADEITGIVSREVIETKQSGNTANLRPGSHYVTMTVRFYRCQMEWKLDISCRLEQFYPLTMGLT